MWYENKIAINSWLTIPSSWVAELVANTGYDAVTIDMQHGLVGYQTAVEMLRAISTTDAVPMVRVPWNEPAIIMRILDAGAYGIICPMINNKRETEEFVRACRYPPHGFRSYGPLRASVYGGEDYYKHANEEVLTIAMIETVEGLENLEEILGVPGLDGLYIGTVDLSISLGLKGLGDLEDIDLMSALIKIKEATDKSGHIMGMHSQNPLTTEKIVGIGFNLITPLTDTTELKRASKKILKESKALII